MQESPSGGTMPLADYLPTRTDLPDQFEPEEAEHGLAFAVPCCCCKHRDRTERLCRGCAHFAN